MDNRLQTKHLILNALSFGPHIAITLSVGVAKSYLKDNKLNKIRIYLPCIFLVMIYGSETVGIGQGPAEKMSVPMAIIIIQSPETVEPKKNSVEFPHSNHFIFPCRKCHHTWKGDTAIVNCTTSDFHDVTVSPIKSKKEVSNKVKAMRNYKKAYHTLCIGCHRDI